MLKDILKALPLFRYPEVRRGGLACLKAYLFDYGKTNRKAGSHEINVTLPIDARIPFEQRALTDYLSFVGLWVEGIKFLNKEFGRSAVKEAGESVGALAGFYPETAKVFSAAQTTVDRSASDNAGIKFKLLHLVDKNRNAAPSMHVVLAAYAYLRLTDIIDEYAHGESKYNFMKEVLFQKSVRILESVLLVKQHAVMDIPLGLAVLTSSDKSFSPERAHRMADAMFSQNAYGMSGETVQEIQQTIKTIYDEVMASIVSKPNVPVPEILIEYLKQLIPSGVL